MPVEHLRKRNFFQTSRPSNVKIWMLLSLDEDLFNNFIKCQLTVFNYAISLTFRGMKYVLTSISRKKNTTVHQENFIPEYKSYNSKRLSVKKST